MDQKEFNELKAQYDELNRGWKALKDGMDKAEQERIQFKAVSAETTQKIEKIQKDLDERESRIKAIETKLARPITEWNNEGDKGPKRSEVKEAFLEWCRKGIVAPERAKALTLADDTTGGYLAPAEYVAEIIKGVTELSPVRTLARVRTTSARSVMVPKRTGQFAAAWVAETGTKTETTGLKYGMEELRSHEMYGLVDISKQDLEDSAFNLEAELNQEFAEQFAVAEGKAFIAGTAVGQPEGITINTAIESVNSGDANLLKADGLIDLFYTLKDAYARNANWLLKRASIQAIRKLKDGNGQYLWMPGLAGTVPNTILGQPYVECVDMDAVAANKFPIAFGDFRRGYTIVDRVVIEVQRDPYTQATSGAVRFIARKRVGGQVTLVEAIKKQKVSA